MDKLVVIKDGKGFRAHPVSRLARSGVAEDRIGGRPVAVLYSSEGLSPVDASDMALSRKAGSVGVFAAEHNGKLLRFRRTRNRIEDRETGSVWSVTGVAVSGPLKGSRLKPVEHGVYFVFAWLAFEPGTLVLGE